MTRRVRLIARRRSAGPSPAGPRASGHHVLTSSAAPRHALEPRGCRGAVRCMRGIRSARCAPRGARAVGCASAVGARVRTVPPTACGAPDRQRTLRLRGRKPRTTSTAALGSRHAQLQLQHAMHRGVHCGMCVAAAGSGLPAFPQYSAALDRTGASCTCTCEHWQQIGDTGMPVSR